MLQPESFWGVWLVGYQRLKGCHEPGSFENLILWGLDLILYAFIRARWHFKVPCQMASCVLHMAREKVILPSNQLLVIKCRFKIKQINTCCSHLVFFWSKNPLPPWFYPCLVVSIPTQVMPEKWASRIASSCESSMFCFGDACYYDGVWNGHRVLSP